ncbi:MAG: hypothetical protein ACE5I9_07925 [Candidatus Methylomirabilales bacterium]
MKHFTLGLLIGALVLGGIVIPAEARGRHHRHHGRDDAHHVYRRVHPKFHHGYHHGHYAGGFLAGAATVLAVEALHAPRVVVQRVYYGAPACRHDWVPGRWEFRIRTENGFNSYYQVWAAGHWQQHCY